MTSALEAARDLFFDSRDLLVVKKELVRALDSLEKAIVVQQFEYWIDKNRRKQKNQLHGRTWTYNTLREWQRTEFFFWSLRKLHTLIKDLEEAGILLVTQPSGGDRTKWYSIDYEALILCQTPQPSDARRHLYDSSAVESHLAKAAR